MKIIKTKKTNGNISFEKTELEEEITKVNINILEACHSLLAANKILEDLSSNVYVDPEEINETEN